MFLFKAENTFLLALDGDVDFKPHAVQLLVDRMRKSKKVGAACGRIHPIGSGKHVYQNTEPIHWPSTINRNIESQAIFYVLKFFTYRARTVMCMLWISIHIGSGHVHVIKLSSIAQEMLSYLLHYRRIISWNHVNLKLCQKINKMTIFNKMYTILLCSNSVIIFRIIANSIVIFI